MNRIRICPNSIRLSKLPLLDTSYIIYTYIYKFNSVWVKYTDVFGGIDCK